MKIFYILSALLVSLNGDAVFVVNVPAVTVYETPEENGHIEDIIRYGTVIDINEEKENWVSITYPGWQGWVFKNQLLEVEINPEIQTNAVVGFRGAYVFRLPDTEFGPFLSLPFETPLKVICELPEVHKRWVIVELQDGERGYIQRSQMQFSKEPLTMLEAVEYSKQFIGLKYLWGGTTSFGYDCSGFVQMVYRQMGMTLPRNSNQQVKDPKFKEIPRDRTQAGDLVFFKNGSEKVVHVGMMMNEKEFIHAFTKNESWICISSLADTRFQDGYFYHGMIFKRLIE